MTQAELEREVAEVTGETRDEVRRRGFSLVVVPTRKPRTVNWDAVQRRRHISASIPLRRRAA